jgi:hypothetical protein
MDQRAVRVGIAASLTAVGLSVLYLAWPSTGPSSPDRPPVGIGAPASDAPTVTPSATPPVSAWPDATTTGYPNAPEYPGSLHAFNGRIKSNTTYRFLDFPDGLVIAEGIRNVTFVGCRFASNSVDDAMVALYGDNITFSYSTFEPKGMHGAAKTVNREDGYQYAIDQRAAGGFTVDHSDLWGWANGIQFGWSTKSKPVVIRDSWFHHARDAGGSDHTDAILENYGGPSNMVFDHNTIVSVGNTNGLALQGEGYADVTVTRNYFSGFGYTVNVGVKSENNKNVVFTDNTYGTDIKPDWGPLYGWQDGNGNVWRRNTWRVAPGGYSKKAADDGGFWWPDGTVHDTDYDG